MISQQAIQALPEKQNLLGLNFYICRLPLSAPAGLVDHGAGIGQDEALAFGAATQQKGTHRRGLADAHRADIRLDEAHRVVNRQPRRHRAAGAVNVKMHVLVGILGLQKQELRDNQVRHVILNRTDDKDHSLFQEPRVDVKGSLPARRLLDNHRHQAERLRALI